MFSTGFQTSDENRTVHVSLNNLTLAELEQFSADLQAYVNQIWLNMDPH